MADDYGFDEIPLAQMVLAGQNHDLLTAAERGWIHAYSGGAYEHINQVMRGQIPMTANLERRIAAIRSGLAKYPIPATVRVTREIDVAVYGVTDEVSAQDLLFREIYEPAFLSTSGLANPPHNTLHIEPLIMDILVPKGTPALRLGELAEVPDEHEVLLIDARTILVVGVGRDRTRNMLRIQAVVIEEADS
ncbi:ADP-ribosyltransferase [Nocardia sp. NPDC004711]